MGKTERHYDLKKERKGSFNSLDNDILEITNLLNTNEMKDLKSKTMIDTVLFDCVVFKYSIKAAAKENNYPDQAISPILKDNNKQFRLKLNSLSNDEHWNQMFRLNIVKQIIKQSIRESVSNKGA